MGMGGQRVAAAGPMLLADISGYTGFLAAVADAHRDDAFADGRIPDAYALVSSLLDGIVDDIAPPFSFAKLEGDAVFVYACMRRCYAGFRAALARAKQVWTCGCDACLRVDSLDLKFVLHAGPFVVQQMAGSLELIGSEVVMVHRLLKNRAAELTGGRPYALITAAAAAMLDIPCEGSLTLVEHYEPLPPITSRVLPLA